MRKVREGETVYVAYRGERVAEIRPIPREELSFEEKLRALVRGGIVTPAAEESAKLERVARRPGALQRFLESSD